MKTDSCATRLLAGASLAVLGWMIAGAAVAQTSHGAPSANTVSGVTVTAAEVVQTAPVAPPLSTAYTEGTITAEQMRNISPGASNSIQTLLNDQPSIFAYTNGPLGVATDINFRAFNSGQFAETYDGVALNDIFNSAVTGDGVADNQNNVLLLPQNTDSVQIYRGINNPSVNSYNSLGGTINFLPLQPTHTAGMDIGASYGSFNSTLAHVTGNTGDIGNFRQLMSYSYATSNGWANNTSDHNNNLYYAAAWDAPNNDELNLIVIFNNNYGHTPFEMPVSLLQKSGGYGQYSSNVAYENDNDTEFLTIIDYRANPAPNISFDNKFFSGYNDYYRVSYANPADSESAKQPFELPSQAENDDFWLFYPSGPTYNPAKMFGSDEAGNAYHLYWYTTWGAGYQPTMTIDEPYNDITIGANVTYGLLHSREFWFGSYDVPQEDGFNDAWDEHDLRVFASAYVQDEIDLLDKRLSITPGVKYIYAYTQDTDAISFFYPYGGTVANGDGFVSPTIGANYKVTDDLAVYASFGQSVKFPDITAYYNGIPGTTATVPPKIPPVVVKPEHVNDYELGVRYQSGGLSGSLSVYREDFTDTFIDSFNPNTFLTVVTNGGSSRYQGAEFQVREDFGEQSWGDVKAQLSAAYNQAKFTSSFNSDFVGGQGSNSDSDTAVTAGEPLADVPDVLVSGDVNWSYQGWRVDFDGRYVGSQFGNNTASGTTTSANGTTLTIPAYAVFDLGLSKTIQFTSMGRQNTVKFGINADNLFNAYYFNSEDTFTPPKGFQPYNEGTPGAPRSIIASIDLKF
jgi:iron complex outermembrane recepter protein